MLRLRHESALHWILVHIAELFDAIVGPCAHRNRTEAYDAFKTNAVTIGRALPTFTKGVKVGHL